MLFYLTDAAGLVSGPHTAGVVRRKLEAGEMSWEDLVCAQGTEQWVPASVHLRKKLPDSNAMICAGCGATEIQRVRVIYEGGTSHSVSQSSFVAVALDFEDGSTPIIGASQGRATQSTHLAARCAPPREEDYLTKDSPMLWILACGTLAVGFFLLLAAVKVPGLLMLGASGLVFLGAVVSSPNKRTQRMARAYYHAALSDYEKRYFCHRCGHMGEPARGGADA